MGKNKKNTNKYSKESNPLISNSSNKNSKEYYFVKFPDNIIDIFKTKNVNFDDILLTFKSGINSDKIFCDVYICVDKNNIYILSGAESVKEITKRDIKERNANIEFVEINYQVFPIQDLTDFKSEENITYGRYIAKLNENYITLFNYTFTDRTFINDFDKYLKLIKEKGVFELDEHDKNNPDFINREEKKCPKCGNYYPSPERKICPNCMDKSRLLVRMWDFIKNFKKNLIIMLIMLILSALIGVAIGYINGVGLYDKVLNPEDPVWYKQIGTLVLIILSIDIISYIIGMVYGIIMAKVSALVAYDLKKIIFEAIQRLSMSFFSSRQTGGLMSQFSRDSNSVYFFLINDLNYFFLCIFKIVVATVIMITINPILTLIVYATVPIFIITFKNRRGYLRELWHKMFAKSRDMGATLSDILTGARVVKVFSKEKEEVMKFNRKSGNVRDMTLIAARYENIFFPAVWFILMFGSFLIWLFGGWFVIKNYGGMTFGLLQTFIFYLGYVLDPLGFFVNFLRRGVNTLNAVQRIFEIMDAMPDIIEIENPVKIENFKGSVEFKEVEFSYEKNRKIIDSVSFEIDPGKALGIVGHTGAGKSTLANLMTRLYDVNKGEILIDGINIKNLSFEELHSMISIVSQETYLFIGTIAENIKYAKKDATPDEIIRAAKAASAHDFIMQLPDGYQTRVGNGQKELSGGEKQRLSIARAVLKNPKILIMDEATAAMDTETERQIQRSLSNLTKDRTTILIAHRLSTLRDVDKLIVMENGKMTESGTHAELIAKKGIYFNLYKMQAQALKSIGIEQ
ncbi:MAG: ABC transporter ATP-binding protein/permease [Oscillospiraceae bacterium]|nr:ABC transporter ATP-binding protein/permease [Oscillospiraceae bacterium]